MSEERAQEGDETREAREPGGDTPRQQGETLGIHVPSVEVADVLWR